MAEVAGHELPAGGSALQRVTGQLLAAARAVSWTAPFELEFVGQTGCWK